MNRKTLIKTDLLPYHITIRSNNRDWFELPMEDIWEISLQGLKLSECKHRTKIESFVLMNNHYHLLLYTPMANIDKFAHCFHSFLSKRIRFETGRINRIFGDRYRWNIINCPYYYKNIVRYIFQNPLRAGLVKKCENYPYSTLFYTTRNIKIPFDIPSYMSTEEYLSFVNGHVSQGQNNTFKKVLSKNSVLEF